MCQFMKVANKGKLCIRRMKTKKKAFGKRSTLLSTLCEVVVLFDEKGCPRWMFIEVLEVLKKPRRTMCDVNGQDLTFVPRYEEGMEFEDLVDPSLVPDMPYDFGQIFL